jgi:hypothetical protein
LFKDNSLSGKIRRLHIWASRKRKGGVSERLLFALSFCQGCWGGLLSSLQPTLPLGFGLATPLSFPAPALHVLVRVSAARHIS